MNTQKNSILKLDKEFQQKCHDFMTTFNENLLTDILDILQKINKECRYLPKYHSLERKDPIAYMALENYETRGSIYLHRMEIFSWDSKVNRYRFLSFNHQKFLLHTERNLDLENKSLPIFEEDVLISLLNKISEKHKKSVLSFLKESKSEYNKIYITS